MTIRIRTVDDQLLTTVADTAFVIELEDGRLFGIDVTGQQGDDAIIVTELEPRLTSGPLVTASGKVLTAADIQALADEAEAGYDVDKIMRRRRRDT